ncbi:hypothetical protein KP509_12G011100 [Ceratopteris richardii]|uniref:Uncharacterized protein n=1 Tax=Ceratopteris richardii TaxID=49495 RepID=A0A8T2TL87_CERRI|nr:hypothetical protein KP509_12G011100 [Ceratopteris richardii]KAH7422497.1 hypothetical protein KP509_12G011100 [Ceratopteris richardii]KAH7422498.1 hypothetical protein KP509_12G011100 [Ceratopteris richardii]KAH7422499.1 hypothetical protein KP509_12G011100 [Ceratopteris richardii]KAH7422500.1 hypothetical protein KP509_12G011100 [Ceratopteris richardii]
MMGPFFNRILKQQFNIVSEASVFLKLVVWEGFMSFINYLIQPWRSLFWFCFNIYVCLWTEMGSLTVKILMLPLRIYDMIQKEETLEVEMRRIQFLQNEYEKRSRELEGELELLSDECKRYGELLEKAEHEKRIALKNLKVLQSRVVNLEDENSRLKAQEETIFKGLRERSSLVPQQRGKGAYKCNTGSHVGELKLLGRNDRECLNVQASHALLNDVTEKHMRSQSPYQHDRVVSVNGSTYITDGLKHETWEVAISSSIFSIFLTIVVGTIVWQSQDPCIPLVMAVFMVVCMSLKTVAQFLLSIHKGPGFDAVALLSFNWFILGTLVHPVLPMIAQFLVPVMAKFGQWLLRVMGITHTVDSIQGGD